MQPNDPLAAAEAARERVAEQVARAAERKTQVQTLAADLRATTATAKSARAEVTVTAQPSGRITAVEFAPAAENLGAAELARLVTHTIAAAQHKAALNAVERSSQTLGDTAELVTQLRAEAAATFPDPGPIARGGSAWRG